VRAEIICPVPPGEVLESAMKSHRPERVAHVVRAVVSEAIARKLSDPRIEPLASITRVEVTADLEFAKVWVSVMGDEAAQRRTLAGLRSAVGLVQRMVAQELPLRHCPHITFHLDQSIKRAAETVRLINEAMAELQPPPGAEDEEGEGAADRNEDEPRSGEDA
jgi:ribosome-binding factor A